MATYLVYLSDTHCGQIYALQDPQTPLYDEDMYGNLTPRPYDLNETQRFLWALYNDHLQVVRDISGDDPLVVIHGGDLVHGNKYQDLLVSYRMADQIAIGVDVLSPWCDFPNLVKLRILSGTAAHNFGESSAEILARQILSERHRDTDIEVALHGRYEVDGVLVDAAHHGAGPGIRHHTKGNQVRYYSRSLIDDDVFDQERPPDLILRGHYHEFVWETLHYWLGGQLKTLHAFVAPSYCKMNTYARQATRSKSRNDFGLLLYRIDDGEITRIRPLVMTIDIRTKEKLYG